MPQVTTYGNAEIQGQMAPSVRLRAGAAMPQNGQELQQLGSALQGAGRVVQEVTANINEAGAKDGDGEFLVKTNSMLHGQAANPDTGTPALPGYLDSVGQDALSGQPTVIQKMRDVQKQISDKLPNDNQKEMFNKQAEQRIAAATALVNDHAARQMSVYQESSSKLRLQSSVDSASISYRPGVDHPTGETMVPTDNAPAAGDTTPQAMPQGSNRVSTPTDASNLGDGGANANPQAPRIMQMGTLPATGNNDIGVAGAIASSIVTPVKDQPSAYQQSVKTAYNEANHLADLKGLTGSDSDGAQARQEFIKETVAPLYVNTFSNLIANGNINGARNYLDTVKGELDTKTVDALQNHLTVGQAQDDSVTVQRALLNSGMPFPDMYKALGDAFDKREQNATIGGVKVDGSIYEHVSGAIKAAEQKQRTDAEAGDAANIGQAQDYLINHPGSSVTGLPPKLYIALEARGHLSALDAFAHREDVTKPAVWFNVQTHLGDGSDKDIVKMSDADWYNMRSNMSASDFKMWTKERDDVKNGVVAPKNDPGSISMGFFNSALNQRLETLGIIPKDMVSDADRSRLGGLQQMATQWVLNDQSSQGKRFNQAEVAKSLDGLFANNVQFRTSFFGIPTGSSSKPLVNMRFGDIPKDERKAITQSLSNRGIANPTDQQVLNEYWSFHGRH